MMNMKNLTSKMVAFATATTFAAATIIACANNEGAAAERVTMIVNGPDGSSQMTQGTWKEVVEPLVGDLAPFLADGVETSDPAMLLHAEKSVFRNDEGASLVIVRGSEGGLIVSAEGSVRSPLHVSWSAEYDELVIDGPDGPGTVQLEGVPMQDRERVLGNLAASALALGEPTLVRDANSVAYAHPVVIVFGIVFGSWLLCITGGSAICLGMCAYACSPNGVASSVLNCGVNITPGTGGSGSGGGALGTCTCNCNPPPTPTATATPATPAPTATATATPAPTAAPTATPSASPTASPSAP